MRLTTELIIRHRDFLLGRRTTVDFFRNVRRWYEGVCSQTGASSHLEDFRDELNASIARFDAADASAVTELRVLRNELLERVPAAADDREGQTPLSTSLDLTFAAFDETASRARPPVHVDSPSDPGRATRLIDILRWKLDKTSHGPLTEWTREFLRRIVNVEERYQHALRAFQEEILSSPGASLAATEHILHDLNPPPIELQPGESLGTGRHYQSFLESIGGHRLRKVMAGDGDADSVRRADEIAAIMRAHVERLSEHLLMRIGGRASIVATLKRYKSRCELHDRQRLRDIAAGSTAPEQALKREMMLWLYDAGLNPMPEADVGGLRADILDSGRLLVEAKRYSRNARAAIITGVKEVRDHALRLAGTPHAVREAFYVVFREDGPLYELPPEIRFEGLTVVTLLIDLGRNVLSGSQQRRPAEPIALSEFLMHPSRPAHPRRGRRPRRPTRRAPSR